MFPWEHSKPCGNFHFIPNGDSFPLGMGLRFRFGGFMKAYETTKIGQNRGRPRLWLDVTSRTIIGPPLEQVRMRVVPLLHGLHGCFALQSGLG